MRSFTNMCMRLRPGRSEIRSFAVVVGSLALFIGGVAKVQKSLDAIYTGSTSFAGLWWIALALGEIVVAAIFLANVRSRRVGLQLLLLFAAFGAYSTVSFFSNRDCGCLGSINASTRNIAIFDWSVASLLVIGLTGSTRESSPLRDVRIPMATATVIVVCYVVLLHFSFRTGRADWLGAANIRVGDFIAREDSDPSSEIVSGMITFANPSGTRIELLLVDGDCAVGRVSHDAVEIEPQSHVTVPMVARRRVVEVGVIPYRIIVNVDGKIKNHRIVSHVAGIRS